MAWENITSKIFQLIKYCIIVYVYVYVYELNCSMYSIDGKNMLTASSQLIWKQIVLFDFSSHICEWISIVSLSLGIKFHNAFYQEWRLAM